MTPGEEDVAFYYQVGNAITEWAFVEISLRNVAFSCIERGADDMNHKALGMGFVSLEGFRAKLDFTDGLVRRRFAGSAFVKEWGKLYDRVKRTSGQRNKLAHWGVATYSEAMPGRRLALVPWSSSKKELKRKLPPTGALCIRDIARMRADFHSLAISVENLRARIEGQPERFPKEYEHAGAPPSLAKLRRMILDALVRLLRTDA
jgi:hypothetical protein